MNLILTPLFALLSRIVGKFLTDQGLKFIAYKGLIITLLTVTFPAVCKNLLTWLFEGLISIAGTVDVNGLSSATVQFTGFAGYLASQLMLPECIGIVLTGCAIRLALNFIPFIG